MLVYVIAFIVNRAIEYNGTHFSDAPIAVPIVQGLESIHID